MTWLPWLLFAGTSGSLAWSMWWNIGLTHRLDEERYTTDCLTDRLIEAARTFDQRVGESVITALCERRKKDRLARAPAARRGWETRRSKDHPGVAAPKADAIGFDNSPGPQEGELAVPFGALQAQQPCESIPAELSTEGE